MNHNYLNNLYEGMDAYECKCSPNDRRQSQWAAERQTYGFDERETWNLYETFYAWLYEHLKMYKERAGKVVDLEYHTFEYEGKTYTQLELIDQICEIIEYYFSPDFDDWDEHDYEYVSNIEKMWAVVMPAMWW